MTVFLIVLGAILLLAAIYFFLLLRITPRQIEKREVLCDYAHRGLHGGGLPENSLAAFALAAEKGYGIELDIQLSKDGEVMVFHDYTLERMTGREGKLAEMDLSELAELRLCGTDERIPKLSEVLALVDGRVPLLIELKGEDLSVKLCRKLADIMNGYGGAYVIESFNPILLGRAAKLMPDVYRGLLYTNVCKNKKSYTPVNIAVSIMALNFKAKPDFVAYDKTCRESFVVKLTAGLYGARRFSWTQKNEVEFAEAKRHGECTIFEGFLPKK